MYVHISIHTEGHRDKAVRIRATSSWYETLKIHFEPLAKTFGMKCCTWSDFLREIFYMQNIRRPTGYQITFLIWYSEHFKIIRVTEKKAKIKAGIYFPVSTNPWDSRFLPLKILLSSFPPPLFHLPPFIFRTRSCRVILSRLRSQPTSLSKFSQKVWEYEVSSLKESFCIRCHRADKLQVQ